jgi:hypothetical protein
LKKLVTVTHTDDEFSLSIRPSASAAIPQTDRQTPMILSFAEHVLFLLVPL